MRIRTCTQGCVLKSVETAMKEDFQRRGKEMAIEFDGKEALLKCYGPIGQITRDYDLAPRGTIFEW